MPLGGGASRGAPVGIENPDHLHLATGTSPPASERGLLGTDRSTLGELPRIGEHDRDFRVPNLQPGEPVGDECGRNVLKLEEGGVPPSTTTAALPTSPNRCIWKAMVPSESEATRFSRVFRSTTAIVSEPLATP